MTPILQRLASDLEGTLHVIAHAGHSSDLEWIKQRQTDLRKDYGARFSDEVIVTFTPGENSATAAYALFMNILKGKPSSVEIAQECEDIVYEYLV